ncbi:serine/threonine-protein kinase [Actinomycetospora termitidis]|uniref:Serine/threonine-protein kinase n=1 Tax=Actinomycetospora termitidis TaxID=3053470 RepID=A0ABT7MCF8_9PSEU|nr:serine/threonine-protein kinase [Actinomycetospora sp. Odt1-22]MDL5158355.1 serine/threonine-protein kinase [Actinomycetospora sp. Odt1-22]
MKLFGQYEIGELIGQGGMGEVHRAYDTRRNRDVALKLLPESTSKDPAYQRRFRQESYAVAKLREPHVVPIHDYGEIDGRLFIDMRLVDGQPLAQLIADTGPLGAERSVALVNQVADALDAAHGEGLVHRDIKPSNILVTPTDFAYVVDFGLAHAAGNTRSWATVSGATLGTLDYMAPERFENKEVDARTDVYALACVLFECLTAAKPFPGSDLPSQMYAHVYLSPRRPSEIVPGIGARLDDVVVRGMAKDPDQRFATAGDLAAAARAALAAQPPVSTGALPVGSGPVEVPDSPAALLETSAPTTTVSPVEAPTTTVAAAQAPTTTVLAGGVPTQTGPSTPHRFVPPPSSPTPSTPPTPPTPPTGPPAAGPPSTPPPSAPAAAVGATPPSRGRRRTVLIAALVMVVAVVAAVTVGVVVGRESSGSGDGSFAGGAAAGGPASPSKPVVANSVAKPTVAQTVPVGPTPGYMEIAPSGKFGYIANRQAGMVTVFDTTKNVATGTIPIPEGGPQFVSFSPDGTRAWVSVTNADYSVSEVVAIDTRTAAVTARIPTGKRPFALRVSPDGSRVYVPNHDSSSITVIDTATDAVINTIIVAPNPHWVDISPDGTRLYAANHESNLLTTIDTATDAVLGTTPVGKSPHSIVRMPNKPLLLNANYDDDTLSVTDTDTGRVVATIPTQDHPQDITLSADNKHAYIAPVDANSIQVLDTSTMQITATVPTGRGPTSVAVGPEGRQAYVTNLLDGTVTIMNIASTA